MTPNINDHDPHDDQAGPGGTGDGGERDGALRIAAVLQDLDRDYKHAADLPRATDTEHAIRAERLAVVCARRAGWWRVLARWTCRHTDLPLIYVAAARAAYQEQRNSARFWRDIAHEWRARAEGRPTSDAAGALSNHHDLGIAS